MNGSLVTIETSCEHQSGRGERSVGSRCVPKVELMKGVTSWIGCRGWWQRKKMLGENYQLWGHGNSVGARAINWGEKV